MINAWDKLHNRYKDEDWIDKPNIFAEEIIKYLKKDSKILELGQGRDRIQDILQKKDLMSFLLISLKKP